MAKVVGLKFKESDYDDFIEDEFNDELYTDDAEPDEEALAAEDEDYNNMALMSDDELRDAIFAAEFEEENKSCWEDEEELEDRGYEGASSDDSAYTIDEYGEAHD